MAVAGGPGRAITPGPDARSSGFAASLLVAACWPAPSPRPHPRRGNPPLPTGRPCPAGASEIRIREEWLTRRHALLLDMMRRHGVAMWIVVNEEFHDDPLTPVIAPPRPYAGNRDLLSSSTPAPTG